MKYAINYRNMHTGIHGLILFDTRSSADSNLKYIKKCKDTEDQLQYDQMLFDVFEKKSCALVQELNYRVLKDVMKNFVYSINGKGKVRPVSDNVRFINCDSSWVSGTVGKYTFSAKLFDTGSVFGINNGRVSKLAIWDGRNFIVNYDRGWDIYPRKRHEQYYNPVMDLLENSPKRFN